MAEHRPFPLREAHAAVPKIDFLAAVHLAFFSCSMRAGAILPSCRLRLNPPLLLPVLPVCWLRSPAPELSFSPSGKAILSAISTAIPTATWPRSATSARYWRMHATSLPPNRSGRIPPRAILPQSPRLSNQRARQKARRKVSLKVGLTRHGMRRTNNLPLNPQLNSQKLLPGALRPHLKRSVCAPA